jgi:hypothetical protein
LKLFPGKVNFFYTFQYFEKVLWICSKNKNRRVSELLKTFEKKNIFRSQVRLVLKMRFFDFGKSMDKSMDKNYPQKKIDYH